MKFEQLEEKRRETKLVASTLIADKYEIIEKIGEGAMGVVYKAKHVELGRIHAIKVLHAKLTDDPTNFERFKREGKIAASLNHCNVASIYDCGQMPDGYPFLVMDFIDGQDLSQMIKRFRCLSADIAVPLFIQICRGLAHAHDKGVVHRDLKPSNVMVVSAGRTNHAKITDFGIAKNVTSESDALTATGEVFGSVLYMSPEQCSGQPLDGRSDIYSLGCLMYETLSGRPPLKGDNPVQTIYKHMNERPASFLDVGAPVPKDVEDIIFRAMEKDPARRFQSAEQMAIALEKLIEPHPDACANATASGASPGVPPAQEKTTISSTTEEQQHSVPAPPPKSNALLIGLLALLLVLGGVGAGMFALQPKQAPAPAAVAPPVTPPATPPVAPTASTPETTTTTTPVAQESPWNFTQTKDGLQIRTNPAMAGQPEMIVIYAHQANDQGRSEDNDYIHMGHVTVNVPERKTNSVLVLAGYSPKVWHLKIAPGTKIEKIILTGLHKQTVTGADGIKILTSSDYVPPTGSTPKDYYEVVGEGEKPFPNYTLNLLDGENALENSNFKEMRETLKKISGRDVSTLIYAGKAPAEIDL